MLKFAVLAASLAVLSPVSIEKTQTLPNGTKIVAHGSVVTVTTSGGQKSVINRDDPEFANQTHVAATAANCASWLQTIQLAPTLNRAWRRAVMNYATHC